MYKLFLIATLSSGALLAQAADVAATPPDYIKMCKAQLAAEKNFVQIDPALRQEIANERPVSIPVSAPSTIQTVQNTPLEQGPKNVQAVEAINEQFSPVASEPRPISYALKKGKLEPQIRAFIKTHYPHITDVVWSVDTNFAWFNNFDVTGETYAHILAKVLHNYDAAAVFYKSNVVKIIPKGSDK